MARLPGSRRNILLGGAGVLGAAVLLLGGILSTWSPGETSRPLDDKGRPVEGGISEKVFLEINGTRQGMIIQSTDAAHPVLLFLHGGPGLPEFFLNDTHPTGLEQDFTLVWWEQRGAGMSFGPHIPPESMTLAQMIADTITVTDHLRHRFGKEKIYLLGHSWGSFLGIQVAAQSPERFHAYIGMGQVSYQLRSEVAAYAYMVEQYRARGDSGMVHKLQGAPATMTDGLSAAYLRLRDGALHRLGVGTTRDMASVFTGVFVPVWQCRAYTLGEKFDIWRGMSFSRGFLWDEFIATDLTTRIDTLDLPVYFFTGIYDFTANHRLARAWFDQIKAPVKGFYTFDNSAHSPLFEEPHHARAILRQDVIRQTIQLADV